MAELRGYTINILLLIVFLGSTAIFVSGYFPLSFSTAERASTDDLPNVIGNARVNRSHLYYSHYTKSVFMVIDALRMDFVKPPNGKMNYINKLMESNEACLINIHVQTPTVTLPRIKALTTGSVPNFIDVAQNFGSAALNIDSIIYQLRRIGRKIVFCGDDTWLKLFPESFERHLENRDSLFVKDFYEGDKNITQRLHTELRHADWDLLILHYLGLDHIGHVEGPRSPRVPVKLQEMDNVASKINSELQNWKQRLGLPALLLVTGDHGMRDTGGHGGNSPPEVNVPLIVTGANCTSSAETYEQIDIAPTLSVVMGLPIPASSIGSLIPELMTELSEDEQLYALHYNGQRLVKAMHEQVDEKLFSNQEHYIQFNEATRLHERRILASAHTEPSAATSLQFKRIQRLYVASARDMSHHLATKYVNYDHLNIVVGLCLTTVTLLTLTAHALCSPQRVVQSIRFNPVHVFAVVAIVFAAKILLCASNQNSFGVCQSNHLWSFGIVVMLASTVCFLRNIWRLICLSPLPSSARPPALLIFVVLATIVHAIFQVSSSFVEEEHQVWYFFGKALLLAMALVDWKYRRDAVNRRSVPGLGTDLASRNAQEYMTCLERWIYRNGETLSWTIVLLSHCGLSHLNQTGDKWLSVPDVGDWLIEGNHRCWNSWFVGVALLLLVYRCLKFSGVLTNILTLTGVVLVYYYRTQTGDVTFPGFKESQPPIMALIFWLNLLEIACFNFVPVLYRACMAKTTRADGRSCIGAIVVLLCLTGALLHKPHNIVLTGMLLWSCERVDAACGRIFAQHKTVGLVMKTVSHFWLSQMFFYYQGNSNSLASVDLNAGYVAVSSFNFAQVSLFLTLNTYHAFFVSLAVLLYDIFDPRIERSIVASHLNTVTTTMTGLVALPTTVFLFVALAFRSHLFVWTVFSPKLLYAFFHAILVTVSLCFVFLINNCV